MDDMKKAGLDPSIVRTSKKIDSILQSLSFKTSDDLYAGIAAKRIPTAVVIERLNTTKAAVDDNEEIIKLFSKNEKGKSVRLRHRRTGHRHDQSVPFALLLADPRR